MRGAGAAASASVAISMAQHLFLLDHALADVAAAGRRNALGFIGVSANW